MRSGSDLRQRLKHDRCINDALLKNVARSIVANMSRFLAILAIVAVGTGVYAGLRSFAPDMHASADSYYDAHSFCDFRVVFPGGLGDDDLRAMESLEGVSDVMGATSFEAAMTSGTGESYQIQVSAADVRSAGGDVTDYENATGLAGVVNTVDLVEGRLPQSADEIVVSSAGTLKEDVLHVGMTLSVDRIVGVEDASSVLGTRRFTIVGLVQSPEWLCNSTGLSPTSGARVTNYAYISREALAHPEVYGEAMVLTDAGIAQTSFTDGYDAAVEPVRASLRELAHTREASWRESTRRELEDARDQAQAAIDQASAARRAAERLASASGSADNMDATADGSLAGVADAMASDSTGTAIATSGASSEMTVEEARAFVTSLASPQDILDHAGEILEVVDAVLASAITARDEAEAALGGLAETHWYILGRSANPSYNLFLSTSQRMDRICLVFPLFFIVVAALVSLTAMRRIVANDRIEIGTLVALGYGRLAVSLKYLVFSISAGLIGAILGVVVGTRVLPLAIWKPYARMYIDFPFLLEYQEPFCGVALVTGVGVVILASIFALVQVLREPAPRLMRPRRPKAGRRLLLESIPALWARMSLSQHLVVRNVLRYRGRAIMTIVGVAGCCALVLTGLGVQNRLDGFVQSQYGGVLSYDVIVNLDPELRSQETDDALDTLLGQDAWANFAKCSGIAMNEEGDPEAIPYTTGGRLAKTGGSVQAEMRYGRSDSQADADRGIIRDVFLVVSERGADQKMIEMRDAGSKDMLALPGQAVDGNPDSSPLVRAEDGRLLPGVILTERLAEELLVEVGDVIGLGLEGSQDASDACVAGIMHNFVGHFVYLSPAAYEQLLGEAVRYNMVLGQSSRVPADYDLVRDILEADPSVISASLTVDEEEGYQDVARGLNGIVLVMLAVSGALAFIVVYALTEINIEERRREVATLKVLGLTKGEVRAYIYRETWMLVAAGVALGLVVGTFLCDFVMRSAEFDSIIFFRTMDPHCYLMACAFTLIVCEFVLLVMRRRLAEIDMVTSLKSFE